VKNQLSVSSERIERLINVLSLLSVGQFDPNTNSIALETEDEFAMLEGTLNVFTKELSEAQAKNREYMKTVESARAELEEKLATIEQQRLAIADLSTPVIELWDDIVTLPVVGMVDTQRSVEMTEKLLRRIVESRAKCVIIDITGVDVVDTMTANHFIKMINSARLLGAYCVVTGISPNIAQTLTQIGVSLDGVPTLRSLKEGLKDCFTYLRNRKAARGQSGSNNSSTP
jgi:rsbT co-antagonist protein RsbR